MRGFSRVSALVCLTAITAWGAANIQNLELVGQLPLGPGFNAGVFVFKSTAYVGSWGTSTSCPATGVKIVDISDPAAPRLAIRVSAYPNTSAESMVVRHVENSNFRGDLLAVGLQACRGSQAARRGVELFDVTNPSAPRLLGRFDTGSESRGVHELDMVQRADGRVLVLIATLARLRIIDATDPARPQQLSDWSLAERTSDIPSSSKFAHSVEVSNDGQMAFLSYADAGVILLDISDPANPRMVGRTLTADGSAHTVAVSPNRKLMLAASENLDTGSALNGYNDWGYLHVYDVADPSAPRQVGAFLTSNSHTDRADGPRDAGLYSIRNPYLAGSFGYLSWYSDGIRVVDLGNPRAPVEVASYVPPDSADPYGVFATKAQVWGVAADTERNLVLASDINFGLYVLRPLEPKPSRRGAMNAANLSEGGPLAPGSIVTIMGTQLAASAMAADLGAQAATLAGAAVKVNGETAQLLFASPEQINFVMPADTPLGPASITIENLGRPSAAIPAEVVDAAPGVFTRSQDGRGMVTATRVSGGAINEASPAHSGDMLWIYLSGLGNNHPAITVSIGGSPAQVLLERPAMNGVSSLLVRVPDSISGQATVIVTANGRSSNVTTLPVE